MSPEEHPPDFQEPHDGHGFMIGLVAGKIFAKHLVGQKPDIDFSMLDYKRFERGKLLIEPNIT